MVGISVTNSLSKEAKHISYRSFYLSNENIIHAFQSYKRFYLHSVSFYQQLVKTRVFIVISFVFMYATMNWCFDDIITLVI